MLITGLLRRLKKIGFQVLRIGVRNLDRDRRMMPASLEVDRTSQIQQRMHQEYVIGFYKPLPEHLDYIAQVLDRDHALSVAFGGDYIIRPDIVIGKPPSSDEEIDRSGILADLAEGHASFTVLRQKNFGEPRQLLHAVISCKWTIRTDRAQNTRTEVLNLIRNRRHGRMSPCRRVFTHPGYVPSWRGSE